jgi:hypothetical protein
MAIGRITGSVLKSNLTRNGVDLAFETNLLYLDVTNSRVGIGTSEPSTALHVVGDTTITGALNISGALTAGSFSPDSISVNNLSSADSTAIQINDAVNVSGTLTAKTFVTNELNSEDSTAIQVNDAMNVSGTLTANTIQTNSLSSTESTAIQVNDGMNASGTITAASFVTHGASGNITGVNNIELNQISSNDSTAVQVADSMNVSGTLTAPTFVTNTISSGDSTAIQVNDAVNVSGTLTANSGFIANAITYPTTDGSNGQFIKTDGAGNLTFGTVSTNSISQLNSNVTVTDAGTGSIVIVADGTTIATFNTATGIDASTSTKSVRLPNGTTGDRPTGAAGMIRYNSTSDTIEGYTTSGGWAQLGATTAAVEDTANTIEGAKTAISTLQTTIDSFLTSTYDSAWYLAVTRDEINEEVATVKYSVVHNNASAFVTSSSETKSGTNPQITVNADVSGGNVRLLGTGTSVVNSVSFYRIGLGDNTTAGTSGNAATILNADVDSATESLDSWSMSTYRGAKYFISVNNTDTNELSNMECLVVHDGTTAYISTYNIVNSGNNDLLLLTADTDSSTVTLRASANTPNCRVTMYRILLGDSETAASGDNINIVGSQTVSSSASPIDTFSTVDFTGCHYMAVGYNATEGAASISEVTVVSDGADAYVTGGPLVSSKGTDQLSFTAALSGTTVTLSAASTSGGSTVVNAYRVQLLRGIGGASTANTVLVNTTQTITGQKTFSSEVLLNSISSIDSTAVQINDGLNVSGTLTANTFVTNNISSSESSAIQINDGMNVSGTLNVGPSLVVDNGVYGSVTTTQFASVFAKAVGPNATSLMQVKGNDGTNGMGMKAQTDANTLIYSNPSLEFKIGTTIKDLDTPTGGTVIATIASTGLTVNGTLTANTIVTNDISSADSSAIQINDSVNVGGTLTAASIAIDGKQAVNGPAFSAYANSSTQTITNGSQQKVLFQTEEFDTNSNFASSTFTPTVAGYYQLNAEVRLDGASGTGEMMIVIWKNGAEYKRGTNQQGTQIAANFWAMQVSSVVYANGTGDYFEIYVQQGSGGSVTVTAVNVPYITWFNGCMIRGA